MNDKTKALTSGRRLARNAVWNFVGMAAPILVGLAAIPLLIDGMGKERFGMLAIIWMGVGYFSLFDMGLGRALTKLVAARLGIDSKENLGSLIWTALFLIVGMGLVGAVVVSLGAKPFIQQVLNVDAQYQWEAISAFRVLAFGLPVVILTTALIGLLEAHQRFASISAIRIPLGVMTFVGPLITLQFSPSLVWATVALLLARFAAAIAYFCVAATLRRELMRPCWPDRAHMGPLFHFGGWLTVTNIVGPLMVYFDRFLIGAILTMTAVTHYVTPYEVISRAQMLPQSIMGVLFPAMTTAMVSDRGRLPMLYGKSAHILFLLMLPVTAGFFLLAPEALELWLGMEFRKISAPVVQCLAPALLINSLARPPLTILQSAGRPDLVAKVHLLELVPYGVLLWFLTSSFGIVGTAAAWSLRVLIDTMVLNEIARRKVPEISAVVLRTYGTILFVLALFGIALFVDLFLWRGFLLMMVIGYSVLRGWPILKELLAPAQGAKPLLNPLHPNN